MTAAEEGVLLLCCRLGDTNAKPMTMPQFRELGQRVFPALAGEDPLRQLCTRDLTNLGYGETRADEILRLLDREKQLIDYLRHGEEQDIHPLTRLSPNFPHRLRQALGYQTPAVFFYRGDLSLLEKPAVAVVGSRRLRSANLSFAQAMGRHVAQIHQTLVSGGAAGADLAAQNACISNGGKSVIFVADRLTDHQTATHSLYLSADGYDVPFANYRALERNKFIHIHADKAVAVQCTLGKGGTWQGCTENLKHGWSELFVYDDNSPAAAALIAQGAKPITNVRSTR